MKVVDGWEMRGGELFPGTDDHPYPSDERYFEHCGTNKPYGKFFSSQNAALVLFRIPGRGQGFRISVNYRPNPEGKSHQIISVYSSESYY